jgi:hypothetical protein
LFARKQGALLFEDLKVDKILFRGKKTRNLSLKLEDPGRLNDSKSLSPGSGSLLLHQKTKTDAKKTLENTWGWRLRPSPTRMTLSNSFFFFFFFETT